MHVILGEAQFSGDPNAGGVEPSWTLVGGEGRPREKMFRLRPVKRVGVI